MPTLRHRPGPCTYATWQQLLHHALTQAHAPPCVPLCGSSFCTTPSPRPMSHPAYRYVAVTAAPRPHQGPRPTLRTAMWQQLLHHLLRQAPALGIGDAASQKQAHQVGRHSAMDRIRLVPGGRAGAHGGGGARLHGWGGCWGTRGGARLYGWGGCWGTRGGARPHSWGEGVRWGTRGGGRLHSWGGC